MVTLSWRLLVPKYHTTSQEEFNFYEDGEMENNYGNYYMLVVTDPVTEIQIDYSFDNAEAARKRATAMSSNPNLQFNLFKMLQNSDPIEVMV
jgi:chloramphenicol O-acetyltransferase